MRSFAKAMSAAEDRPAFSNATEGDGWMYVWCQRCTHDTPQALTEDGGCPLVMVALMQKTPVEWKPGPPGSLSRKYECTEFEAIADPRRGLRR